MSPSTPFARAAFVEGMALAAAVAALAAFAYAPRAGRAATLLRELALEAGENERLGARLAGQGDVVAEMRALEDVAGRFRTARLAPGLRGETSTLIRAVAARHALSVSREGAWSGSPQGDGSTTLLRKEMTLRGTFRGCEAFLSEIESSDAGFVVERLAVRRDRGERFFEDDAAGRSAPNGGGVSVDVRLLAIEGRTPGERR